MRGGLLAVWMWGVGLGCAGQHEQALHRDLSRYEARYAEAGGAASGSDQQAGGASGADSAQSAQGLPGYVAIALAHNPAARVEFERWKASVRRISQARSLPDPTLSFGYFIRSVETRVGPQRARISLQQAFPWPTKLSAGADAASAEATAAQRRFEAEALTVVRGVAQAYWDLWQVRATRAIHREHLQVVRALSKSVLARIATGAATLADQQQVDLTAARLEDAIAGMDEHEIASEARLRRVLSSEPGAVVATPNEPAAPSLPAESQSVLSDYARNHPRIQSFGFMAEARRARAEAERAARFPSFTLGADWILIGEALDASVPGSGKDALSVAAGIRVPLWQGSHEGRVEAARAESRAHLAEQESALDLALSELVRSLSAVRDSARRVSLHRSTLLPQAESAYASVLGAYASGRGTVAQTLLSQRDLLELRVELARARADHARSWAWLEFIAGREVAPASMETVSAPAKESTRGH